MTDDGDSLAPGFLIGAPQLEGGPFERAVILMVHHDQEGAMGFIINKAVDIDFGSLLESADQPLSIPVSESSYGKTVFFGGPVRVEQLWVVFQQQGQGADASTAKSVEPVEPVGDLEAISRLDFHPEWALASSSSVIESLAADERPGDYLPIIGYAGWGPGQLESEIEEGSWLAIDFEADLLVDTPPADRWEAALDTVGLDPASFLMMGRGGSA
jgi:putative transcriptional regulator